MAQILRKCSMLLTVVSLTVMKPGMLIEAEPQVPCLFFFGDSYSDNGNNNVLITTAKGNYPPYGIDFPVGPTGRFSNGKNGPDVLAQLLGFNKSMILPYVKAIRGSPADIVHGVNHASASSGIFNTTGIQFGDLFSIDDQLQNHQRIIGRLASVGRNEDYLRQCLYVVNIGTNDYLNYYMPTNTLTRLSTPPSRFAENVTEKFKEQLMKLYQLGARKVAVFALGKLGCLPLELELYPIRNGSSPCVDKVNDGVQIYNNRLKSLLDQLNNDLSEGNFTYINITSITSGDLSQVGITVANASCCKTLPIVGSCIPNSVPCSNRTEYAFYDDVHPTENFYSFIASRAYDAAQPSNAHPFDIKTLVGN